MALMTDSFAGRTKGDLFCRQALRPRLLVPIMLGALVGAYNTLSQDPLTNLLIFDMLLGFLCYKVSPVQNSLL